MADSGAALIAAERQRQIAAEGWTPEHDAQHTGGELARAGACYALPQRERTSSPGLPFPRGWPWGVRAWKPEPGSRLRELVKAAALIAAEIDRLIAAGAAAVVRDAAEPPLHFDEGITGMHWDNLGSVSDD